MAEASTTTDIDASRIAEVMDEDEAGFWRTCSGCHDSEDGYDCGHYPHSEVFRCKVGSGCGECGGLGVIWDSTDWSDFADWSMRRDRTRESVIEAMRNNLKVLSGCIHGFAEAADAIMALDFCDSHQSGSAHGELGESAA
jgi:hypothetical protein